MNARVIRWLVVAAAIGVIVYWISTSSGADSRAPAPAPSSGPPPSTKEVGEPDHRSTHPASDAASKSATRAPELAPPAPVSLDETPPPLKLYRCAVYARLLGESASDAARRAELRRIADELDSIVEMLGATAASGDPPAEGLPDAESVRRAERARAQQAGPRREQWLEESYARCDQEVAWALEVSGSAPPP
jgi:type IV secretory pathway VirB10-like protein